MLLHFIHSFKKAYLFSNCLRLCIKNGLEPARPFHFITFVAQRRDVVHDVISARPYIGHTSAIDAGQNKPENRQRREIKLFVVKQPAHYGMESPKRVNEFWGQSETTRISACGRTHLRTGVWRNRPESASGPAALFPPNPRPAPAVPAPGSSPASPVPVPADPTNYGGQRSRLRRMRRDRRADTKLSQTSVWVHFFGSADRRGWQR